MSASKKAASADQLLASPQHFGLRGDASPTPPPLPYRAEVSPSSEGLRRNDDSTKSQDFFSAREGPMHRLSNSMDPLLVPQDVKTGAEPGVNLDVEPYLQPIEVQFVMGALAPNPAVPVPVVSRIPVQKRDSNFRSMRLPKQTERAPIPYPEATEFDRSLVSRTLSLKGRGHRRSHSNPGILENGIAMSPPLGPPVPPRTQDIPPPVPPRDTPRHKSKTPPPAVYTEVRRGDILSPIESSLDFPDGTIRRGFPQISQVTFTSQKRGSAALTLESEDDNISNISGPFEEIDEPAGNMDDEGDRIGSPSEISSVGKSHNSALSISDDRNDDLGNQYAKIDEFQQYLPMAPASAATLPASIRGAFPPSHSPPHDDGDSPDFKRERLATMHPYNHRASVPVLPTERDRAKTLFQNLKWKAGRSSVDANFSITPPSSKRSQSMDPHRPLPPSPTKLPTDALAKKISTGSNIYEVIDEDYLSRVRNKKRFLGEGDVIPEFAPPVEPENVETYLEVVHRFFSIPEVREYWISCVQAVLPEGDPSDFPPPFYSLPLEEHEDEPQETETESQENETESQETPSKPEQSPPEAEPPAAALSKVKAAVSKLETATSRPPVAEKPKTLVDDRIRTRTQQPSPAEKQVDVEGSTSKSPQLETPKKGGDDLTLGSKRSPRSSETVKKQSNDKTSSSHSLQLAPGDRTPGSLRAPTASYAKSTPTSPATRRLYTIIPSKPSPPAMARSSSGTTPPVFKKTGSRDNMIEFLNRTLNHVESSESESEDSDSESEMDQFDQQDDDPGKLESSQTPDIPLLLSFNGDIEQTDLDAAVMRPSVSTDSDFASDAVKSPQSNSTEEMNQITSASAVASSLVPRRSSPRRKEDLGEARNLRDSGINISNCHSQTFDDAFNEQNFESDC